MWQCSKCREKVEDTFEVCWNCGTARDGTEDPSFKRADDDSAGQADSSAEEENAITVDTRATPRASRARKVIVTTGNEGAGHNIAGYIGIVRGSVVRSPTIAQGFLGGLQQIVGGNSEYYAAACD